MFCNRMPVQLFKTCETSMLCKSFFLEKRTFSVLIIAFAQVKGVWNESLLLWREFRWKLQHSESIFFSILILTHSALKVQLQILFFLKVYSVLWKQNNSFIHKHLLCWFRLPFSIFLAIHWSLSFVQRENRS